MRKVHWTEMEVFETNVEGTIRRKVREYRRIEVLKEFEATGSVDFDRIRFYNKKYFVSEPSQVDWTDFPKELSMEEIRTLGEMKTTDEHGIHYTKRYSADLLHKLEDGGWIQIQLGVPYSEKGWKLEVTTKTKNLLPERWNW